MDTDFAPVPWLPVCADAHLLLRDGRLAVVWLSSWYKRRFLLTAGLAAVALDGFGNHTSLVFRWFALALAVGIIATTVLGLVMAFKRRRGRGLAVGVTLVGLAVPALFLWLAAR